MFFIVAVFGELTAPYSGNFLAAPFVISHEEAIRLVLSFRYVV